MYVVTVDSGFRTVAKWVEVWNCGVTAVSFSVRHSGTDVRDCGTRRCKLMQAARKDCGETESGEIRS